MVDCCIRSTYSHTPFSSTAIYHHILHIFQSVDCCVLYCNPPIIHLFLLPSVALLAAYNVINKCYTKMTFYVTYPIPNSYTTTDTLLLKLEFIP